MKIVDEVRDKALSATPVEKALSLNLRADGTATFASDVEGAKVSANFDEETGLLSVSEVLADGSTGETMSFSVVETPASE